MWKSGIYKTMLAPTDHLTLKQFLILLFMHTIGAAILDAGINFGIATAMYYNETDVTIWFFPNTLAGDAAVTVFVQGILTYLIDGMLTSRDIRKGQFPPLRAPSKLLKKFPTQVNFWFKANSDLLEPKIGANERARRFGHCFARSLVYSILMFFIFWPLGVGILWAVAGTHVHWNGHWNPQIFKASFGGGMGFFQTPIVTLLAMMRIASVMDHEEAQPISSLVPPDFDKNPTPWPVIESKSLPIPPC